MLNQLALGLDEFKKCEKERLKQDTCLLFPQLGSIEEWGVLWAELYPSQIHRSRAQTQCDGICRWSLGREVGLEAIMRMGSS